VDRENLGGPLIVASLMLAVSVLGASYFLAQSIDRGSKALREVVLAVNELPPGGGAPDKPARVGRPDPSKRYEINLTGAPLKGSKNSAVTIVEWSDFQCPFCKRVGPTLAQVEKEYGDRVSIAFKHLPLSIHPKARGAHIASEAAHQQGKFWEMHDKIFANQRDMDPATFVKYAEQLGLDVDRYKQDVASAKIKGRVDADSAQASKLGVTGTPAFFINGRFLSGAQPFPSFKRIIDEELKEKS
jgi:protein-disulfide isomerase